MKPRGPTFRQIAAAAQVSHVTVSLSLRNHLSISGETRARIQNLAREMGYRPDPELTKLMTHLRMSRQSLAPQVVAFVNPLSTPREVPTDAYTRALFEGARKRAEELGYQIEEFWLKEPGMNARRFDRMMTTRNIRGLLLPPMPRGIGHVSVNWGQYAAVALTYSLPRPSLHRVCPSHHENMTLAMRELRRLGYQKPGFVIAADMDQRVHHAWKASFLGFQSDFPAARQVPVLLTRGDEEKLLPPWLARNRPDVVLSGHWEFFDLIESPGLKIPDEIGFVTMASSPKRPELACVNENTEEVGRAAMDQLAAQLQHNEFGIPKTARLTTVQGAWQPGSTVRKVVGDASREKCRRVVAGRSSAIV